MTITSKLEEPTYQLQVKEQEFQVFSGHSLLFNMPAKCYKSPTHKRRPKCKRIANGMCTLCQQALVAYSQARKAVMIERKAKNPQSAAKSHDKKIQKFSDNIAEHIALKEEKREQQSLLDQLDKEKKELREFIRMKTQERESRKEIIAYDLAKDLVKCPKETLQQLHHDIAKSIDPIASFNSTY